MRYYIPTTRRYLSTSRSDLSTSSSLLRPTAPKTIQPPPPSSSSTPTTPKESHFYRNKVLDRYASRKPTPVTLRQLLFYERHRTHDRLLTSANYVRQELPIRLAHRLREFQNLPFIVGVNPHLQQVYNLYWEAFDRLRAVPPINTLEDNEQFCQLLHTSLQAHRVVIPQLALGIQQCPSADLPNDRRDKFMNATLRSRISRRVLAEQHLILSNYPAVFANGMGGVMIFQHCSAHRILAKCIQKAITTSTTNKPDIIIDPGPDVDFAYVGDHIEYILYQVLLNAIQQSKQSSPIRITICTNQTDVFFRISDQAGGIPPDMYRQLWSFGQRRINNFQHVEKWAGTVPDRSSVPPLGMGLPMSKVYAEYWGGDINLQTLHGWGTDAYVRIPKLGDQMEHLDVEDHDSDLHVELDSGSYITHRRRFVI
ncbi:branched-chain alpha-ketoacid dehydrogenase [Chlamydoabsidia padenii]|nr:branched-chain alpha-ketoacid dehydrogenase [Chlamydoabsidia padenii]